VTVAVAIVDAEVEPLNHALTVTVYTLASVLVVATAISTLAVVTQLPDDYNVSFIKSVIVLAGV
jgi:hypothetical protein